MILAKTGMIPTNYLEENKMHARPEIKRVLIAKKLRRWMMIARYPHVYPRFNPAQARKNFWRLLRRYPEIASRLGLTELSVYEPI
jgi:hypothetical protein